MENNYVGIQINTYNTKRHVIFLHLLVYVKFNNKLMSKCLFGIKRIKFGSIKSICYE